LTFTGNLITTELKRCPATTEKLSKSQNQSYIKTDSQSASLSWCQAPIWDPQTIFPLLSLIIFRQLRVCQCEAPSLARSRGCTFQFLLGAAFLRSESHGTHEHILLCLFLRLPNLEGQVPVFISPRNRVAQLYPGHWVCLINLHIAA
jgi:hypothetical protein